MNHIFDLLKTALSHANGGHVFMAVAAVTCISLLAAIGVISGSLVIPFVSSVTFAIIGVGATKSAVSTTAKLFRQTPGPTQPVTPVAPSTTSNPPANPTPPAPPTNGSM